MSERLEQEMWAVVVRDVDWNTVPSYSAWSIVACDSWSPSVALCFNDFLAAKKKGGHIVLVCWSFRCGLLFHRVINEEGLEDCGMLEVIVRHPHSKLCEDLAAKVLDMWVSGSERYTTIVSKEASVS